MLAGMLMQFIPGVKSWPEWQMFAGVLLLSGGIFFYLGCKRAARQADKAAYSASRTSSKNAARVAMPD